MASDKPPMKPPAWKQWLITISVIWPLTMVVPWAFGPLFKAFPALGSYGVSHGILASVIVAIVVWLVMPRYTRLVHNWLFRKQ
jgi:antibiotic biosynthesis monooxygenase (ABM) superfamily enzyme